MQEQPNTPSPSHAITEEAPADPVATTPFLWDFTITAVGHRLKVEFFRLFKKSTVLESVLYCWFQDRIMFQTAAACGRRTLLSSETNKAISQAPDIKQAALIFAKALVELAPPAEAMAFVMTFKDTPPCGYLLNGRVVVEQIDLDAEVEFGSDEELGKISDLFTELLMVSPFQSPSPNQWFADQPPSPETLEVIQQKLEYKGYEKLLIDADVKLAADLTRLNKRLFQVRLTLEKLKKGAPVSIIEVSKALGNRD